MENKDVKGEILYIVYLSFELPFCTIVDQEITVLYGLNLN